MKMIKLTCGKITLIDDEDFNAVNKYKWYANKKSNCWYAMRSIRTKNGQATEFLHRFLLKAKKYQEVDHINGNGLDNRRENIRVCSHTEHQYNRRKKNNTTSKYKGVTCRGKQFLSFYSRIRVNGKSKYLGCFKEEAEAAIAYDVAALRYFGEFAKINFPILRRIP